MATYTPIEIPMTVTASEIALPVRLSANLIIGGSVPVLESVKAHPEAIAQTIEPSTGYDGLSDVTIKAVTVDNLSAENIVQGVTISIGDEDDEDRIASVTGTAEAGINPTGTLEITSNGTANVYSYQYAEVDVPNTYAAGDEGKVVRSGELVSQTSATYTNNNTYDTTTISSVTVNVAGGGSTLGTKNITANGTYDAEDDELDGYSEVTVAVPASAVDTGTKSITANGTHDVVGYASASVNVPNTYSASDEGKVVDNGALVAQTAHSDVTPTTSDQTIDTTTNNSIKIKGDADLVAANIKKDVDIFGVTGSYEGGGGGYTLDEIMTGYPAGAVNYTPSSNIEGYDISGRSKMTSLTVNITGSLEIQRNGIAYNSGLTSLTLVFPHDYTKYLQNYAATGNNALISVTIKGNLDFLDQNALRGNSALKVCDITKTSHTSKGIGQNEFYGSVLDTLILRRTDAIIPLENINAFTNGTKFRNGGGGGTLYVPNALISSYQGATNWSTLLGYTGNVITKIEGTTYETTYADGTAV